MRIVSLQGRDTAEVAGGKQADLLYKALLPFTSGTFSPHSANTLDRVSSTGCSGHVQV